MNKISKVMIIVATTMILLGIAIIVLEKIEEDRCYNLPLNEYKEDKSCMSMNKENN